MQGSLVSFPHILNEYSNKYILSVYILSPCFWRSFQEKALWKPVPPQNLLSRKKAFERKLSSDERIFLGYECMASVSSTVLQLLFLSCKKAKYGSTTESWNPENGGFPYDLHYHCVVFTAFQDRCLILGKLFTLSHQRRDLWMLKEHRREVSILIWCHFKPNRRR